MPFKNRLEACNPAEDIEMAEDSGIRKFRIAAADGKSCDAGHHKLSAIVQGRLFVSDFDAEIMRIARNAEGGAE